MRSGLVPGPFSYLPSMAREEKGKGPRTYLTTEYASSPWLLPDNDVLESQGLFRGKKKNAMTAFFFI